MKVKCVIIRRALTGVSLELAELVDYEKELQAQHDCVLVKVVACHVSEEDVHNVNDESGRNPLTRGANRTAVETIGYYISGIVHRSMEGIDIAVDTPVVCSVPATSRLGCAQYAIIPHYLLVPLDFAPFKNEHADDSIAARSTSDSGPLAGRMEQDARIRAFCTASALIQPALRVFDALHARFSLRRGDSLLVTNACNWTGVVVCKEAIRCGFSATLIVQSQEQVDLLQNALGEDLKKTIHDVINTGGLSEKEKSREAMLATPLIRIVKCERSEHLWDILMAETDSIGVNFLLDLDNKATNDEKCIQIKGDALSAHAWWAIPYNSISSLTHSLFQQLSLKGTSIILLHECVFASAQTRVGQYRNALKFGLAHVFSAFLKLPLALYDMKHASDAINAYEECTTSLQSVVILPNEE